MDIKMSNIDNSAFSTYYTRTPGGEAELLPMSVVMAGDEQCSSTYVIRRGNAEISVLIYLMSGEGELTIDGTTHALAPNDVLTLPQGAAYEYRVKRGNPWRILWFNITGEVYPYLLKKYNLLSTHIYRQVGESVRAGFLAGMEICKSDAEKEQVQAGLCVTVYGLILALWQQYRYENASMGIGQQLRQYIDDSISADPAEAFSVEAAGRRQGTSVRQLERAFKKEYDMTPYQYFQRQKLMLAKQYLKNTTLTIKEISNKLGFCDQYYFSNCFKAQEGVPPRGYRE